MNDNFWTLYLNIKLLFGSPYYSMLYLNCYDSLSGISCFKRMQWPTTIFPLFLASVYSTLRHDRRRHFPDNLLLALNAWRNHQYAKCKIGYFKKFPFYSCKTSNIANQLPIISTIIYQFKKSAYTFNNDIKILVILSRTFK